MRFLPNSETKNLAERREKLSERLEKEGITPPICREYREIFIKEGKIYDGEFTGFYEIKKLAEIVFLSAIIAMAEKGKFVFIKISGDGVYEINSRLFEAAVFSIFNMSENLSEVALSACSDFIKIEVSKLRKNCDKNELSFACGLFLRELNSGKSALFIPADKSMKKADKIKTEHLFGRYSASAFFIL